MSIIIDPVTFSLTNSGEGVGTVEYITVTQSMYAQARVPDVGDGSIAVFGLQGSNGYDFYIAFTNVGGTLSWYYGPDLTNADASGTYLANDMFSVYADKQTVIFKKNDQDVYRVPDPYTAPSYRMSLVFANSRSATPITFTNVLFYPSGARGSAGTPYTLAVEAGDADILTSSSFELVSAGDIVRTLEAFPTTQGVYMQARIPGVSGGAVIGLGTPEETGENRFIRFLFASDKSFSLKIKGFEGDVVYGTYESGDLISMFLDDTALIVYRNGVVILRVNTQGSGIESKIYQFYSYSFGGRAVFTDVAFYQTSERGQDGSAFTTLVPQNEFAFVTSPTSFRLRSLDPFADTPPVVEVFPSIQTTQELDGTVSGIYLQFKPFVVALGSGDRVEMRIENASGDKYGFTFRESGGLTVYNAFSPGVFGANTQYALGDKFALYVDGTVVSFIVPNGVDVPDQAFIPGSYKFKAVGSFVTHTATLYDTTDFAFYSTGRRGQIGPTGAIGNTGPRGATGPQGNTGLVGSTGPQGLVGSTGPQGLVGSTGPQGTTGPQGLVGTTGSTGPRGTTGPQGNTGPTGPSGPVGKGFATLVATGSQILGPGEIGYMTMGAYNVLPTMQMGNVARVDAIYGNDSIASIGRLPFKTVEAAIAAIGSTQGITIWVLPGTYNLPAGITVPAGCAIRGLNVQTSTLQILGATGPTTLLTMGASTRVEDLSLKLTSTGHHALKGIVFGGTTTQTAKLRTCVLTVDNSTASTAGTSDVYGVECNGTGAIGPASFSFNSLKGSTVNVLSNGGGKKRGVLVSGANCVTSRDFNVYVAAPTDTASTGSYVGVETNDASNLGSIQLRSSTIGTTTPVYTSVVGNIQKYTAADIFQSTPSEVENPTYLATAGIQIGPGTDIVSKKTGARPFSTYVYPTVIQYGLKGNLLTGQNGFLWTGTQAVTAGAFPDQSGTFGDLHLSVTSINAGNEFTVSSTVGIIVGMPVVFSMISPTVSPYGGLTAGTIYYVQAVTAATRFTVSTDRYGPELNVTDSGTVAITAVITTTYPVTVTSTNSSNVLTVSNTTGSGIVAGMPIVFSNWFGTVNEGTPYYIKTVPSGTTMTLSPDATLATELTTGTFTAQADTTGIVYTGTTRVTASSGTGNGNITVLNSGGLVAGMPIVFASSFGGLTGGTLYYIFSVVNTTTIRVTSSYNGTLQNTTSATGLTVNAYVFNAPTIPAYYRVQQPSVLSGMNVALGLPATAVGGTDTVVVSIYRTPANANQLTGLTLVENYTMTFSESDITSKSYYNSSKSFGAGDKIHVYLRFTSATTAHDLTVQLDTF